MDRLTMEDVVFILKEIKKERQITNRKLSEMCNVSERGMYRILNGESSKITPEMITLITFEFENKFPMEVR